MLNDRQSVYITIIRLRQLYVLDGI